MKRNDKLSILLLVLSTFCFIYQHSIGFSWDFQVYLLNAKHWFAGGDFFEIGRAPLMSLLMGAFLFLGRFASYGYIILVSCLFYYSCSRLAKKLGFNPLIFYLLSLNVYALSTGLKVGTELLVLSLLQLFAVMLLEGKSTGGGLLGLMFLSKYTHLIYFPLLLFYRKPRKILKSLIWFILPILAWLIASYLLYGHPLASIADEYAKNVYYRADIVDPINILHFVIVLNFLTPLIAIGIFNFKKRFIDWVMVTISFLSVYSYVFVPIKIARYLFNLLLPGAYFAMLGVNKLNKRLKVVALSFIIAGTIISLCVVHVWVYSSVNYHPPSTYEGIGDKLVELGIEDCAVKSNVYVYLNSVGILSTDAPRDVLINHYYDAGYVTIIVNDLWHPDYNLSKYNVVFEDSDYYIIKKPGYCEKESDFSGSYLVQLNEIILLWKNEPVEQRPCYLLFENSELRKFCRLFSFNRNHIANG